tara:strand:- start:414 stop:965 length:552 start_codon:yes stop_codon:yes gene_type:complete
MKKLDDIWDEYINDKVKVESLKDLAWHIENDPDPLDAITMAADMRLKELGPSIARQLDNEDDYIREVAISSLLGRLCLADYAKKGLDTAINDPYESVRDIALFNLGEVINQVDDKELRYRIAAYIYQVLIDTENLEFYKGAAYNSMLASLGINILDRPRVEDLDNNIDLDFTLIEQFKNKYNL